MNTLKITGLKKTYPNGVTSINDISLEIRNGMFGLLGPNGAGKSSLMRTIAALQKPDEGTIEFNDIDIIKQPNHIRKNLGYLPQDFGVYPKLSAFRLLEHLAVLKGVVGRSQRTEQINALLQQTNLFEHRHKAVHSFSGGMRQRFGIAQALLGNPQIIIVDEPTAGLDPEERHRFNNLLSEIGEQVIVILSTHIVEDVKDLCTDMAIIIEGTLISHGKPSDYIDQLKGMTWGRRINKSELPYFKEHFNLISSRLNGGKLNIKVVSKLNPGQGFESVIPDLEDVYFNTLFDNSLKQSSHV